jgi:predicted site-specific integrase-resolvase
VARVPLNDAATICGVKSATIRAWAREGRVVKYPDGFDTTELLLWIEQRSLAALCARVGLRQPQQAAEAFEHAERQYPLRRPA